MGGFLFVAKNQGVTVPIGAEQAEAHFKRAGFHEGFRTETDRFRFIYYSKQHSGISNVLELGGSSFSACVGTLIYEGLIGPAAMARLMERSRTTSLDLELRRCSGHFALVTCLNGQVTVRRDGNASYEVYHDESFGVVSSSFLAVARALNTPRVSRQEVMEYVFNGVTFGAGTPIEGVRRLDLGERLDLLPGRITRAPLELAEEMKGSVEDAAAEVFAALAAQVRQLAAIFGPNMTQALSGGYDTRLLLALFRHVGVLPRLFVYGEPYCEDVRVAKTIAEGEGMPLEHVDKSLPPAGREEFREVVARNFLVYDGLAHLGVFEHSTEYEARLSRHRGGALNVNGGGGEVMRNFFGLPDQPIPVERLISSFFSQFEPAVCRQPGQVGQYREALGQKMLRTLGTTERVLSRRQVDALYPHFRCRSWFGRDNNINAQYGYGLLPFYDAAFTDTALRVPVRYKHFGDFEGRLIRRADARLAGYPSQYGHDFARDAPLRHRAAGWLSYRRPGFLRRRMYTLRGRLQGRRLDPDLRDQVTGVVGAAYPYMSRQFDMAKVWSAEEFLRISSLEYLFQELSAAG